MLKTLSIITVKHTLKGRLTVFLKNTSELKNVFIKKLKTCLIMILGNVFKITNP